MNLKGRKEGALFSHGTQQNINGPLMMSPLMSSICQGEFKITIGINLVFMKFIGQ